MAKAKVKKKGQGFTIEGTLDFNNSQIEVDEIGSYPFEKIFKQFDGKLITIKIDEPDEEIVKVPEE